MKQARLGPIALDLCFPCHSVWFDDGELAQLVQGGPAAIRKLGERLLAARQESQRPHAGKCPVCWVPMGDFEFPSMPGLRLDGCGLCLGFWVSLETLGIILKRVEERRAQSTAATATRDLPAQGPLYPAPPLVTRAPARGAVSAAVGGGAQPPGAHHEDGRECPGCGEFNSACAAVCWACGGFMRPNGVGQCPACASPMEREVLDVVDFGFCAPCGGVWLDDRKLDALRAQPGFRQEELVYALRDRTGAVQPLSGVPLNCPRCHEELMPEALGMISTEPIRTCPKCYGSFLERGRLAELLIGKRL